MSPNDQPWPSNRPVEVELSRGDVRLAVDLRGGGLRRLAVAAWEVLDGYPAGSVGAGWRGAVLLPWPNRVRYGRWSWEGLDLQLDVSSVEEPHAIHGLAAWQRWEVLRADATRVTVGATVEPHLGYPFRLAAAVDYELGGDRLAVTLRVRNIGTQPAPFGAGFHPYFSLGADADGGIAEATLALPAQTELVLDGGLPTGARRPFDGAVGRIGDRVLDVPLTDLARDDDGWTRVRVAGAAGELEFAADRSWPWLQVYTSDHLPAGEWRRSLAVEPMTCPPNALADGVDLVVLQPGGEWSGTWTLAWQAAP